MAYVETQSLQLHQGWNLVSFYVQVTIDNIIGSSSGIKEIQSATQKWRRNYLDMFNTLSVIDLRKGYWVYLDEPGGISVTISLTGTRITGTISYALNQGWTLIGVPSDDLVPYAAADNGNVVQIVRQIASSGEHAWKPGDVESEYTLGLRRFVASITIAKCLRQRSFSS